MRLRQGSVSAQQDDVRKSGVEKQEAGLDGPDGGEGKEFEDKGHDAAVDGPLDAGRGEGGGGLGRHVVAAILGNLVDGDDDTGEVELGCVRGTGNASWHGLAAAHQSKDHEIVIDHESSPFAELDSARGNAAGDDDDAQGEEDP